ncbi:MAG: TM2 domain-containing protein [Dehalococcoidales bacterium]|jgi:TM2 domain-containing membrane protein YozV|nr:TM2 domain-containing protein [Dehalococcoidales bacterium]
MEETSPKSRRTTALLAVFLGCFGMHRFYLDKTPSAVAMLVMGIAGFSILGTILSVRSYYIEPIAPAFVMIAIFIALGIWALVDFIVTLAGKTRDSEGRVVKNW